MRSLHDLDELAVGEGITDHDILQPAERRQQAVPDDGVEVGWQDHLEMWVTQCEFGDGMADPFHRTSPVLAAVRCDQQDRRARSDHAAEPFVLDRHFGLYRPHQGVDDGVPGDDDVLAAHPPPVPD